MTDATKEIPAAKAAEDSTSHGVTRLTRTSLAAPRAKLAVPPIPGYHTHWFRGGARVEQALAAGFEFVKKGETAVHNHGIGASRDNTEGSDLGSQVSIIAGGEDEQGGQPSRLYLMKLRNEWKEDDDKLRQAKNDLLIESLRRGDAGADKASGLDFSKRITGRSNRTMFSKRT